MSRKRGLGAERDHAFTSIEDDGKAAQAAFARRMQDNLLVIDGRVHHRVPAPGYVVFAGTHAGRVNVLAPDLPFDGVVSERSMAWAVFPAHALQDAQDLAMTLMDRILVTGDQSRDVYQPASPIEIHDVGLGLSVSDWVPFPMLAADMVREHAKACRPAVGYLDDEGIHLYQEARSVGVLGYVDEDEAHRGMVDLARLAELVASIKPVGLSGNAMSGLDSGLRDSAAYALRATLRYETVELPRLNHGAEDDQALEGIRL